MSLKGIKETLELAKIPLAQTTIEYLYPEDGQLLFMNTNTLEMFPVERGHLGTAADFLPANTLCEMLVDLTTNTILYIEAPSEVELLVESVTPGNSTETQTANLETGANLEVPASVVVGNKVKINPQTGAFIGL